MIRYLVIFSGQVQGVGFRWTLVQKAYGLGLTGWVKNREDGKVEAQIQGDKETILGLIRSLDGFYFIQIDDYCMCELPIEDHEHGFEILDN